MAKRKSRKSKRPPLRETIATWWYELDLSILRRGATGLLWVLGAAGVVIGVGLGVPRLETQVAATVTDGPETIQFVAPPAWLQGDLESWLVITAREALGDTPLRRDDLMACRQALESTGCFESVRQVRRLDARTIEVDAVFLLPFAIVRDADGDHLVDTKGRLLPPGYRVGPNHHFIRIVGSRFDRPPRAGLIWDGSDIRAGLQLIRSVLSHPWWAQIHAINVSDLEHIVLNTSRGCRIIWGSPVGEAVIGEAPAEEKIMRLDYLHTNFGRLDVDCPNELDISDPNVVTAR